MASILPGFEYDIFVSYRHNDNRSGWVTEFVNAMQEELAATIKDPVNIYFDRNPHDGLLETHSVDKSLEGKLKCLIFIPIISQTYCDTKSFAWQHEFCAFNRMAKEDLFGRDIKLSNGNVASRILPIKIHDLDSDDKALLEGELGGVLRAVDFIYKESGVNRPLRSNEENPTRNQNQTVYRNQINKVANAIKELIAAMHHPAVVRPVIPQPTTTVPHTRKKSMAFIAATLLLAGLLFFSLYYYMGLGRNPEVNKSIVVLPFTNMSDDKQQEYFSDGMMEEILNQLVKVRDLKVISRTSSMTFKNSKLTLKEIAAALGASNVLEGSVRKSGDRVRITVQLIEANTDNHLWSETYDRDMKDIFSIQTDISMNIARELKTLLTKAEVKDLENIPTQNEEAYDQFLRALQITRASGKYNVDQEIALLDKAIELDPKFIQAYLTRANAYLNWYFTRVPENWEGKDKLAQADIDKVAEMDPGHLGIKVMRAMALHFLRQEKEAIQQIEPLIQQYPNKGNLYSFLGYAQRRLGLWNDAIRNEEKGISLDPANPDQLFEMGRLQYALKNYESAIDYFDRSHRLGQQAREARQAAMIRWTGNAASSYPGRNSYYSYYFRREFADGLKWLDTAKYEVFQSEAFYSPKVLQAAMLHFLNQEPEKAKSSSQKAIALLEQKLGKSSGDHRMLSSLGIAYALAGQTEKGMAMGEKASQLSTLSADPFCNGVAPQINLVLIYVISRKYDLAIDKLEYLLSIPGESNYSIAQLKADPLFDKMRSLPRFQKLLKTP